MELRTRLEEEKTVPLEIGDQVLTVTYYPNRFTQKEKNETQALADAAMQAANVADSLSRDYAERFRKDYDPEADEAAYKDAREKAEKLIAALNTSATDTFLKKFKEWDLTLDGVPVPLTPDALLLLDENLPGEIMEALTKSENPSPKRKAR